MHVSGTCTCALGVSARMCASKLVHTHPAVCSPRSVCAHACQCVVCYAQCVSVHGLCLHVCMCDCARVCMRHWSVHVGAGGSVGSAITCQAQAPSSPFAEVAPAPESPHVAQGLSLSWGRGRGGEGTAQGPPPPGWHPPSAKSVESDTVATGVKSPPPTRCSQADC